jgi:hypothetical protein
MRVLRHDRIDPQDVEINVISYNLIKAIWYQINIARTGVGMGFVTVGETETTLLVLKVS